MKGKRTHPGDDLSGEDAPSSSPHSPQNKEAEKRKEGTMGLSASPCAASSGLWRSPFDWNRFRIFRVCVLRPGLLRLGIPRFGISRLWTVRNRVFDHCGVGLRIFKWGVLGFGVLGFGVVKRRRGRGDGRGRDLTKASGIPLVALTPVAIYPVYTGTSILAGVPQALIDIGATVDPAEPGRTPTGVSVDAIHALSLVFTTGGLAVVDVLSAGASCPALLALTNRRQVFVPAGAVSAVDVFAVVNCPTTPSSFKARSTLAFKSGPVVHTGRSVAAGHGRASITLGVQADEARLAHITIIPGRLGVSR